MQGYSFVANVLSLPLDSYDLVLGIQWLRELGEIRWNFKDLYMKFIRGNTEYVLKGDSNQKPFHMDKVLAKQK